MNKKNKILSKVHIQSIFALYSNGQFQEALDTIKGLIKDYPNDPWLYNISGVCYKSINQLDSAVQSFEKALSIKSDDIKAYFNLGIIYMEIGQLDTAVKFYEKVLALNLNHTDAQYNLAITFEALGQLDAAVKSYEKVLARKPDHFASYNNLGVIFNELGQFEKAIISYNKALIIKPNLADAYNNLGVSLSELGNQEGAVTSYKKAITIKPDFAEACNNLGNVLKDLGQLDAAVISYKKAITIKPDFAEACNNLGNVLKDLGQLDAALKSYEKAITIKPDFADAHRNLGGVLLDLKRLDEAMTSFERALVLNPKLNFLLGHLLHTKMHLSLWDGLSSMLDELGSKVNNGEKVISPFPMLGLIDNPEIQRKNSEIYTNNFYIKNNNLPEIGIYPNHKKIRIGYFSPDFREHPVSDLSAELYELHDRNQFEIYAFSFGPDTKDHMNLRIKAGVDNFHDVRMMSHKNIALLARSLEIEIAIDLCGYTVHNRAEVFAMSVAPIQVGYLGFTSTLGSNFMDYIIADRTVIPEDNQVHYSEKIAYMPNCYMVNDSKITVSKKTITKKDAGLPSDSFIFCCFNNFYKINPIVFKSWMNILSKVSGSILWLPEGNSIAMNNLKKEFKSHSIDENRLFFAPRLTLKEDHLNRLQLADLFIDTFPFNAHTTCNDALMVGLPVLTCIGDSFTSRVASSQLNSVNLPELITTSPKHYESLAIELATFPEKLKIVKDKLANNLSIAPLYDTPLFVKYLESAYLTMYDRYQKGLDPDHIYVEH